MLEIWKARLTDSFKSGANSNFCKTPKKLKTKEKQKFVSIDNLKEEESTEKISTQYKEVIDNQNSQKCEFYFNEGFKEACTDNHLVIINGIHWTILKQSYGPEMNLIVKVIQSLWWSIV